MWARSVVWLWVSKGKSFLWKGLRLIRVEIEGVQRVGGSVGLKVKGLLGGEGGGIRW